VFKGNYVHMETVRKIKSRGYWIANFYPDVSFLCHKSVDIGTFRHYDHIFTTKSFGVKDFADRLGISNTSVLAHGFDPWVHRPFRQQLDEVNKVDVSFIGTWSPHKQNYLQYLCSCLPEISLKIWGDQWERSSAFPNPNSIVGYGVLGDFYALAISSSKINLGLLSEKRFGASSGDQVTSRTFHIPASGGFLLHQRTPEVSGFYEEGKEMACFDSPEELVDKVRYYLANDKERQDIANAGHNRCVLENSLAMRAAKIIEKYEDVTTSMKKTMIESDDGS